MEGDVRQKVAKQLVKGYLVHMLVYIVAVLALLGIAYWWCNSQIWYSWDELYPLVHWLHVNVVAVFLGVMLIGCVAITCVHFYQLARMLELVTTAVDDLYSNRINSVKLPASLQEVERKLNEIMIGIRDSQQEAKDAEQRKNDMIIYMAHDLKTPLTSVIGYLTLLKDEPEISQELRQKYLDIAWNKAGRLEDLVNEFFELTRMNFAHMSLNCSMVNMSMMVEQFMYEFKPLLAEKGMDYQLETEPEIMVYCDIEKMQRVFDNLLKNAINYGYSDSMIHVYLEKNGEQGMRLIVQNHGQTIPAEKLSYLFEQFFRLDSSRDSQTGGTGLGLAIAKQIVELHGGRILAKSDDNRTQFVVTLPSKEKTEQKEGSEDEVHTHRRLAFRGKAGRGKRVQSK